MKNLILSMCMVALSTMGFGQLNFDQWETVEIVDEFGDPTGDSVKRIFANGTFSNSATANSDLIAKVVDYGDAITIDLYEYSSPPSASMCYDGCFGSISIKRENGDVEKHEVYASDSGGLYISESRVDLLNLFRNTNGETIKIVIYQSSFSKYGSSSYKFSVITQ
jgi:hypothetical protein